MNDPDFEDGAGVQIVGLADVLLEAGRDADAISLLVQAQEAWNKFNMAFNWRFHT